MTRDEILEVYRPLRTAVQRVLHIVTEDLAEDDLFDAINLIAPWAELAQLEGEAFNMVMDTALFEPDPEGGRGIDLFLDAKGQDLAAADRDLLERMSRDRFSLFRVAERHESAGVWLEDLLEDDRRFWMMDEGLEASGTPGMIISVRIFDAGPYHAGFGIITQPGDETLGPCLAAKARRVPVKSPGTLAALVYSDHLAVEAPMSDEELEVLEEFAELFGSDEAALIEHDPRPKAPALSKKPPAKKHPKRHKPRRR